MNIRIADKNDYMNLAEIRWEHAKEDDAVYGEKNLLNVDKEKYIYEFINFMNHNQDYKIFIVEENGIILVSMFVYLIPKIPMPNCKSKYIAYLTKVYTQKEFRNKQLGTKLLNYIKEYLKKEQCELIFVWPSDNSINWYCRNEFNKDNEIYECILMDE